MSAAGLAVVGAGIYGPAGRDATEATLLLRTGLPLVGSAPFSDGSGSPVTMGVAPGLGDVDSWERLVRLAVRAGRACLRDAERVCGVPSPRVALALSFSPAEVATQADATRLAMSVQRGLELAGGLDCLAAADAATTAVDLLSRASEWAARGNCDIALWGGVHSDYDARRIAALAEAGGLYTNENIEASFAGEHAAFVALAKPSRARAERPLATIVGCGALDGPLEGDQALGVTSSLLKAVLPNGLATKAGWVFGDIAFERRAVAEHGALLVRAQAELGSPFFMDYPAQRMGAMGAAAAPLGVALIGTSWAMGHAPSLSALVTSCNGHGRRGLVALQGEPRSD